ncbi:hypothetical protein N657DRAFT_648066 [Parathielavia appendiculata]|uniref:Uncharacterized protein n=1 Tax=Parathielavia appendiculata TaxID=2587402 RepID=A0AAN6TWL6_9PEZI|nr:hypothetical protein N657DRAFT_648066 [Parathielavia appendiculata]
MISTADLNVERSIDGGFAESVRWAQPTAPCMPWHSPARSYYRLHRADRIKVTRDMIWYPKDWFDDVFKPGCIEIRQAHIVGAGTPEEPADEEDLELKQVDFGRVRGTARLPKGKKAPPRKGRCRKLG